MLTYLHIPFCDTKCNYCAFCSFIDKNHFQESYMNKILVQLENELNLFKIKKQSITSLFIGGGTPSVVEARLYKSFFDLIKPYLTTNAEITSEANPCSLNKKWLETMHSFGLNRLSIGIQSFDKNKLTFLGRSHNSIDAIKAVNLAHEVGLKNISIDLIVGTKLDTKKILQNDLDIALNLPVTHVSAYSLSIEKGTKMQKHPSYAKEKPLLHNILNDRLTNAGFEHYEVSSYGKIKCNHNIGYWMHKPYMGIGCGAVGFHDNTRYSPHASLESYIKNPIYKKNEFLDNNALYLEKLFLGLRSCVGIGLSDIPKKYKNRLDTLLEEGKIYVQKDRFFVKDFMLADEIVLYLFE